MRPSRFLPLAVVSALALTVAACGGGTADSTSTTTTSATSTTIPSPQPAASLEEVRAGVVRIEVEGTFEYPSGTSYNEAGSGSGFFISEDGYIVTNNHVVAGAGLIRVHVDGETTPYNGRVVGTSECADLALVDIDATDRRFLAWTEDAISAGEEIYVAGFPLGEPEYTLIDGIISKERAAGDSDWASVDAVLEHTGDTLPGSSGGPIVARDGSVLGVNYAGDDLGQAFGISAEVAQETVARIMAGEPTLSIGINGWAYEDDVEPGIWVASVVPDSPADRVGIQAGDFITKLAGLEVAEDGTMATYCDILDSHKPDRPFDVEVWRSSEDAYLEGVLHSSQTLEISDRVVESGLSDLGAGALATGDGYDEYESYSDSSYEVRLEVPVEWDERESGVWEEYDEDVGVYMSASPDPYDPDGFWDAPGVFVGVSETLLLDGVDPETFVADIDFPECQYDGEYPYDDGYYAGVYRIWYDCGEPDAMFLDWAATNQAGDKLISAQFTMLTEADLDAAVRGLETIFLIEDLIG